jgi:hypothetical protein
MLKSSAPAVATSRAILREYSLEVKIETGAVGMTASIGCVAIVIDHATNIPQLVGLRPELHYWQRQLSARKAEAPQLASFLKTLIEAYRQIPRYAPEEIAEKVAFETQIPELRSFVPKEIPLSKADVEAVRFLNHFYKITPIGGREFNERTDCLHMAEIASYYLGLDHAMKGFPLAELFLDRLKNGQATEKEIRLCFRDLGVFLEYLPNYRERQEEMMLVP